MVHIDVGGNPEAATRISSDRRAHGIYYKDTQEARWFEVEDGTLKPELTGDEDEVLIDFSMKDWDEFEDKQAEDETRARAKTDSSSLARTIESSGREGETDSSSRR